VTIVSGIVSFQNLAPVAIAVLLPIIPVGGNSSKNVRPYLKALLLSIGLHLAAKGRYNAFYQTPDKKAPFSYVQL